MKRIYLWFIVFSLGIVTVWRPAYGQDSLQALYKAAKAEGEVTIWSPLDPWEIRLFAEEFSKEFPGIKINQFEIRPDDYAPRVIAEARQGMVSLDVGTGRLVGLIPLLSRGLIQGYDDWTKVFKDLNPEHVSKDGRLLSQYSLLYLLAYNPKLIKPEEVPTSWDDLLNPKWKGRIILEPRVNAFAYLGLKWGEEKMVSYLKRLKQQDPVYVKGGARVNQQLIAGVAPLAVGTYVHQVLQKQSEGAPIAWAEKVSPIGSTDNVVFAAKGAKHPNAAKLFAGWLSADKAQRLMNAKMFRGTPVPGSPYGAAKTIQKHKVEIIPESLENHKEAARLNKIAVKVIGVLR